MSIWLRVNPDNAEELTKRIQTEGSKVKVEFLVSSYDIPEAVRGSYNKESGQFVIEFRYVDNSNEPTKPRPQDNYVTFIVGKNSSRLYQIEIDVKALKIKKVELRMKIKDEVKRTLDNLIQRPINRFRQDNYKLTQKALSEREEELFSPLSELSIQ